MAWRIFMDAFNNLFANFGVAIKVSLVPSILSVVLFVGGFAIISSSPTNGFTPDLVVLIPVSLVLIFGLLFLFGWTAVLWHRAAILNEHVGIIPHVKGLPVPRYAGRLAVLALITFLMLIPIALVVGLVGGIFGTSMVNASTVGLTVFGTILNFIFGAILTFIWLRLAATLPGIALDRAFRVGEGWSETSDISGAILLLAMIITIINMVISFVMLPVVYVAPQAVLALDVFTSWFTIMLGLSILTQIYLQVFSVDNSAGVFD